MSGPWLVEGVPAGPVRRRLFCLPFAGGGAAIFEPWRRALPGTAISAVRLPGRENRFREPALADVDAVLDGLVPAVAARVAEDRGLPWAVFGYSLGGLLAYELVARLAESGGPLPAVLLVGGAEPPHVPRHLPDVSWLPREEFVGQLRELGGTSPEILEHPELLDLLLPMVRADFRIVETHRGTARALPCPIVTYRGSDDDGVRPEAMARWSELTAASVTHRDIAGGHFVISDRPADFISLVAADLGKY